MSKISVAIPIFNVELYLSKYLGSIISQTYKNLKTICINYSSIDNSLNILKEIKTIGNKKHIKLFSLIPIITIKEKYNKTIVLIFGFLPILTIGNKEVE